MQRNTAIMAGVAAILFVCLLIGFGMKHSANSEAVDQENWQFGDWDENESGDEANPVQPVKPDTQVKPDTPVEPQGQITATSFDEAMKLAREKKMMVLMYFHADWCVWCRKMETEVFTNAQAKGAMEKYILLKIDAEKDKEMAKKFQVRGLPAFIIVDRNEHVREREAGYKKAQEFTKWLTRERKDATIGK